MNILYTNGDRRCVEIKNLLVDNKVEFIESKNYSKLMKYELYNLPYVEFDYKESCGHGNILGYNEIKERYRN